ncbi:hypothetical protein K443DRAFT_12326 [Laccaria amethystina LaAM-08-1]|uniref:Uncharacterized protein n=1 Tax=Laccaria amethystina LaAM-08-1 TaxID=1095629 RepID=A0A0C9X951_9AGAR|nr:hypothetical protein K443DRAFT_12326 [Laccaria amethystina LaAM-08-1]
MLEILSGRMPYHYLRTGAQVVMELHQAVKPRRPAPSFVDDGRWSLIQCWTDPPSGRPDIWDVRETVGLLKSSSTPSSRARYGARLSELEKKLVGAYRELTASETLEDEGLFDEEDEEEAGASAICIDLASTYLWVYILAAIMVTIQCLADLYTDILLQRLVPSGSPTFHDYGKRPPAFVLDLGCGPGHWMLYAAGVWKSSIITGLNLVNLTLPEVATTENVHFRRGTFPPTKGESRDSLYLNAPVDLDLEAGVFDEVDDTSDNDGWADANSAFMSDQASSNDTQLISPLTRNNLTETLPTPTVQPEESELSTWAFRAESSLRPFPCPLEGVCRS